MALNTQVIGKTMPNGFAGSYAQQPDMIIDTHPAGGTAAITFGTPLKYDGTKVVAMGASDTAAKFVGIASREVKTTLTYLEQGVGQYAPGEPVSVFKRGVVNVICQKGTPALGGAVYLRVTANTSFPNAVVGGLEAEADSANTVQLTNCQWGGAADTNKVAAMRIMTIINA